MKLLNNKNEINNLVDKVLSDLVNAKKDWRTFLPNFRQIVRDAGKKIKITKKNFDFFNEQLLARLKKNEILHTNMFRRSCPNNIHKKLGNGSNELIDNLVKKVLFAEHNFIEINLQEFFVICEFFLNGKVTKLVFCEDGYLFQNKEIELVYFEQFDLRLFDLHYHFNKNETR